MKNKKYLILLTFIVTITVCCIIPPAFARYRSSVTGSNSARVAKFVLNFDNDKSVLSLPMNFDEEDNNQKYYFEVFNNVNEDTLEVATSYNLSFTHSNNLPITYKIYGYNKEADKYDIPIALNDAKTEDFTLKFGEKQNDKYMIDISWDIDKTDYRYSSMIDYFLIKLNAVQVD